MIDLRLKERNKPTTWTEVTSREKKSDTTSTEFGELIADTLGVRLERQPCKL
jgi:hypothetical protein